MDFLFFDLHTAWGYGKLKTLIKQEVFKMRGLMQVQGMSCTSCVNSIEGGVGKLIGVSSVKVDVCGDEVVVEFDNAQRTEEGYNVV